MKTRSVWFWICEDAERTDLRMRRLFTIAVVMSASLSACVANAACPQALATYRSFDGVAELEFVANSQAVAMSHEARLIVGDRVMVVYGSVLAAPVQTVLSVQHDCPSGDVTGAEIADCTITQAPVYAIGGDGRIGDMVAMEADAAAGLVVAGLAQALVARSDRLGVLNVGARTDLFALSGCQE